MSSSRVGLVYDQHFLAHDTGTEHTVVMRDTTFEASPEAHPSSLSIIKRTKEFLDGSGFTAQMHPIAARRATTEELAVYHTRDYIEGIKACAESGPVRGPLKVPWGEIDDETVLSPGSYEAALYAAGGAMNAVQAVLEKKVPRAYALLRPPCHHAMSNQAMGFCIFNNTVIAAHYARNRYQLERVMIIDWDVHHGNGTQDAFYADPGVLFVSLHQENWFPRHSGALEQVGSGAGVGTTVNIPLPPGTGDRGYQATFEQLVIPIGMQFRPECIIVTSGLDGSWLDPLAHMMLTMNGYHTLTRLATELAEEVCNGRLVLLHAGGYSAPYVPYCTLKVVEALLDIDCGLVDLYAGSSEVERCQTIFTAETRAALLAARTWHRQWWKL